MSPSLLASLDPTDAAIITSIAASLITFLTLIVVRYFDGRKTKQDREDNLEAMKTEREESRKDRAAEAEILARSSLHKDEMQAREAQRQNNALLAAGRDRQQVILDRLSEESNKIQTVTVEENGKTQAASAASLDAANGVNDKILRSQELQARTLEVVANIIPPYSFAPRVQAVVDGAPVKVEVVNPPEQPVPVIDKPH